MPEIDTVTFTPSHPIFFLLDPRNDRVELPTDEPGLVVSCTPSCLSVRTVAEPDGDVTATISSSSPPPEASLKSIFIGTVQTPTGYIALLAADNQILLEHRVDRADTSLQISVDNPAFPSWVWVQVT